MQEDQKKAILKLEHDMAEDFVSKSGQAEKQQVYYMFDKWKLLTLIHKYATKDDH
jgi:hypothetical protein